jgi:serine/threonine protein phosphatase PrpC
VNNVTSMKSRLTVKLAGLTDQGKIRSNNEDAVWTDADARLLVVADGMGGHNGGEVASRMAIASIPATFKQLTNAPNSGEAADNHYSAETNRLASCFKIANQMIFEASRSYPEASGMGTTCTAALISGDRLSIVHVGDTRCYLIRRGELELLTQDHSLAMDQLRSGLISKEEAAHIDQNILTRSLGTEPDVLADVDEHPVFPGDVLLLCSDGVNKELTDEQILAVVNETPDPQRAAQRVIDMANASGGQDNISVAVARLEKTGFGETIMRLLGLKK